MEVIVFRLIMTLIPGDPNIPAIPKIIAIIQIHILVKHTSISIPVSLVAIPRVVILIIILIQITS